MRILGVFIMFCVSSCQTQLEKPTKKNSLSGNTQSVYRNEKNKGMFNPLMLSDAGGADIGRLYSFKNAIVPAESLP